MATDKLTGKAKVPANEETQIDEKLTKKMSAADVIHDFVHSDDPKFAGKSTKERQKMALGAYYGMRKKKVDEAQLDELHGKGDIEKIAAARHKKIMTSRATVPDSDNPHFPAHDRAVILKHMRTSKEVSREAGKKKDINYPTYKGLSKAARDEQKKRENLEETSEKLRLAYTNKAMQQTREKEKKPGEHYKREVGIHRAARLMLRDKKTPQNEELKFDPSTEVPKN